MPRPKNAPARFFSPRPQSVAEARRFVRNTLHGAQSDMLDTAQLLVSELVTNAVMYAHTEVEVCAWTMDGCMHVQVSDREPGRVLIPHSGGSAYAGTGWGLAMVEQLAYKYGAFAGADHKTVWFELWPPGTSQPPTSGWTITENPDTTTVSVTLANVPGALHEAAQKHREALLRESLLAVSDNHTFPISLDDLQIAQNANHVIGATLASAAEDHIHGDLRTVRLELPTDMQGAVNKLSQVLDETNEMARQGQLLTRPALPQISAATRWLLGQIASQLAGHGPISWTEAPRESGATSPALAPWNAGQLETSSTPTIAADDGNRIIDANTAAAELLGWDCKNLIGQRITAIIPEHLRERHIAAFTSLLLTGHSHILGLWVTFSALRWDGQLIEVSVCVQTQEAADGRSVFVARLRNAKNSG
ncbi:PAS domain S-box protein [Streptomyces sp. 8L]|nr:PAS domain S-box protein [Streptomyces sp. 8L]